MRCAGRAGVHCIFGSATRYQCDLATPLAPLRLQCGVSPLLLYKYLAAPYAPRHSTHISLQPYRAMLLQLLLTAALVPSIAAVATPQPSSALLARQDKPTCREFAHNPSRASWNFTGRLPMQRLAPTINCPLATEGCPRNSSQVDDFKIGWKYYWDAPVTVDLPKFDPASVVSEGAKEVVVAPDSREVFGFTIPPGKTGAIALYVRSAIRVPGTFKNCDDGQEHTGSVVMPGANGQTWVLAVQDESGNWLPDAEDDVVEGSEASIMSADELKDAKASPISPNDSRGPHSLDARLVGPPLAVVCLSLALL